MPDSAAVKTMFGQIARRYDAANRLLSGGRDRAWRRRLVAAAAAHRPRSVLDLATGSGDVAYALSAALPPEASILGMDFCLPMLEEAEKKRVQQGSPPVSRVAFAPGDGLALPLTAGRFDVVTIAFGLRNMADRHRCLVEMRRVLRPGGLLLVLEFSQPQPWFRPFYLFYLRHLLPWLGGKATGEASAYRYLNTSIEAFPGRQALEQEIAAAGFREVSSLGMAGGAVALHRGVAA